jgi:shikimate kinase/3-dehydroquinate synthase
VSVDALLDATLQDKKVAQKRIRWIMPRRIGDVTITTLPDDLVREVVTSFFTEERP